MGTLFVRMIRIHKTMRSIVILFFTILSISFGIAQPTALQTKKNPYKWMFGLSWSVIDDNGYQFTKLFDLPGSWNYEYFPTRLSVDRFMRKGWSFESTFTYNKYYSNKIINGQTGRSGLFLNLDAGVRYSFRNVLRGSKRFEPYVSMGIGGTYRTVADVPINMSINTNLGMNYWFSRKWGAQIQTSGKISLLPELYQTPSNYMQHTLGVVYRIDPKKRSKNTFDKRKYPWAHDRRRFNRKNT